MGSLRFTLAVLVLLAHAGSPLNTFGPFGAVEAFFVLSGTFMAAAYAKNYAHLPWASVRFFISRYLRLWPSYAVLLALTFLLFEMSAAGSDRIGIYTYFNEPKTWIKSFSVFSLVGQDILSIHTPTDAGFPVRQSWSVSAELVFYALVPLLFRLGPKVVWIVFASLALKVLIQPVGSFQLELFGSSVTLEGWRLSYFPFWGGLFFFSLGFYVRRLTPYLRFLDPETASALKPFAIIIVLVVLFFPQENSWFMSKEPHNNILFDVLLLFVLANFFDVPDGKFEAWLGTLSYHIYLSHLMMLQALTQILKGNSLWWSRSYTGSLLFGFLVLVASASYAVIFEVWLQRPIDQWRARVFKHRRAPVTAGQEMRRTEGAPALSDAN